MKHPSLLAIVCILTSLSFSTPPRLQKPGSPLINGQGSYNWFSGSGSGSGTITGTPGATVYVTVSGYGPSSGEHLTEFYLSGATLVGSPMGNAVYEDNNSLTCHFVMPTGGSVSWSGSFTENDNEGTGDIAVNY